MNSLKKKLLLDSFVAAPDQLESALKSIDLKIVDWKPGQGEWSVRQVVFHVVDGEANYYLRIRKAIAEPGGTVIAYDQNKWTDHFDYPGRSIEEGLRLFRLLRTSTYQLMAQLPDSAWANTVQHSERGTLTLENLLNGTESHVLEHLRQIQDNVTRFANR
ncbi:DinB family protein [Dehalogenimonas etheniformans]|uniref:DinB-like domain-containing protein n=1 Tax=Dehalogenimonas etheniformans TaxID=1536648 RepID=A0A2P5P552_9CHLR|nr:DinB family protein [Dehalogenimonas etheniformans]PPD57428.1 hypothetical protein JP09_008835 [Dehalogenimonas etheniformans]QNT76794.1 DinB family protein [Dehalogenimonas etheniformans]